MAMERYSFTKLDTYKRCEMLFKLRYIDKLSCFPNTDDADNPLFLGQAMHVGIEKGVDASISYYEDLYPITTDLMIDEEMKLAHLIPKVQALLKNSDNIFEYYFNVKECDLRTKLSGQTFSDTGKCFEGYIDVVCKLQDGTYALYDFKYTSNTEPYITPFNPTEGYSKALQLYLYKEAFEIANKGAVVSTLGYILIPKTRIRQKKTETLDMFRTRLRISLETLEPKIQLCSQVELPQTILDELFGLFEHETYNKTCNSKICKFCEFCDLCTKEADYMLTLPSFAKRQINPVTRLRLFVFGKPLVGKTRFANTFPKPLFLNTDGNINSFDSPYISIGDRVENNTAYSGWVQFKEAVTALQNDNEFCTICVDLIEDVYELCRKYWCTQLGIDHESKNAFTAWDLSRQDFLSECKKLANLRHNVIFISHQDDSRDLTKRNGTVITMIKPALTDKLSNKIAGMVDITGHLVDNNGVPTLQFKRSNTVFGGSRLALVQDYIPADYNVLTQLISYSYNSQQQPVQTQPLQ